MYQSSRKFLKTIIDDKIIQEYLNLHHQFNYNIYGIIYLIKKHTKFLKTIVKYVKKYTISTQFVKKLARII